MAAWSDNIRKVEPYVPGEQPKDTDVIKLNTNENPYGPSQRVKNAIVDIDTLRLYPDPTASALVDVLAEYHGVDPSQVFVGVGSDDVLAMSFLTFSTLTNQYCSLTLHIPSMMCGQSFSVSLTRDRHLTKTSGW